MRIEGRRSTVDDDDDDAAAAATVAIGGVSELRRDETVMGELRALRLDIATGRSR